MSDTIKHEKTQEPKKPEVDFEWLLKTEPDDVDKYGDFSEASDED